MKLLPSSPLSRYITTVELDGTPVNPTYVDLETGRVQYWVNGVQTEAQGEVRILLTSRSTEVSLHPALDNELSKLLEDAKRRMALMSPEARVKMFEEQKASLLRALSTPCEHGVLDFETCPECQGETEET